MSVETIHPPAYSSEGIAIRHAPPAFWIVMTILIGPMASLFWLDFFYDTQPWAELPPKHQLALFITPVVVCYLVWRIFDRRVVISLDADGIRDRRLGSVLLRWSHIKHAEAVNYDETSGSHSGANCGVLLRLDRPITIVRFLDRNRSPKSSLR
jgi:hypothetical protein